LCWCYDVVDNLYVIHYVMGAQSKGQCYFSGSVIPLLSYRLSLKMWLSALAFNNIRINYY
jgi:hypothetical protein